MPGVSETTAARRIRKYKAHHLLFYCAYPYNVHVFYQLVRAFPSPGQSMRPLWLRHRHSTYNKRPCRLVIMIMTVLFDSIPRKIRAGVRCADVLDLNLL